MIHKLFKVLVPRYLNYTTSFTSMYLLSNRDIDWNNKQKTYYVKQDVLVELKGWEEIFHFLKNFNSFIFLLIGNPYPSLINHDLKRENLLHNILLSEMSKEYYKEKTTDQSSLKNNDNLNNQLK